MLDDWHLLSNIFDEHYRYYLIVSYIFCRVDELVLLFVFLVLIFVAHVLGGGSGGCCRVVACSGWVAISVGSSGSLHGIWILSCWWLSRVASTASRGTLLFHTNSLHSVQIKEQVSHSFLPGSEFRAISERIVSQRSVSELQYFIRFPLSNRTH